LHGNTSSKQKNSGKAEAGSLTKHYNDRPNNS